MSRPLDYSIVQKCIHWLMAILITLDLFVAQKFGNPMEQADRLESRGDHGSLGTIVAVLFLLRLYLRFKNGAPALPATNSEWQIVAARLGHGLLYFFIGFLILSGILTAMNATDPISLFGKFDISTGQLDEKTFTFIRGFHEFATNGVIALILIHSFAAVYHWLIAGDDVTQKMLKFWKSERA